MHNDIGTSVLVLIVAALYSSVGHGGASGYLAILSLFGSAPAVMASTALVLNILVATLSAVAYFRAGHFKWKLVWPFLAGSVPAAFIGGSLKLPPGLYYLLLALTLLFAAVRLVSTGVAARKDAGTDIPTSTISANVPEPNGSGRESNTDAGSPRADAPGLSGPRSGIGIATGAVLGLLSGMVGIGGGVFLTPLMVLMRWSGSKAAAAASAVFIVINSIAGLLGRSASRQLELGIDPLFLVAAFIGGAAGSYFGAVKFSETTLRRALSGVLIIAAFKLILVSGILPKI
ncbi:MAG: sulfite exporter TauE/SafE family protein [Candidatus Obscuribacterales bacterium]|nr:sulfite exporter TauE/SafE family protein [Candidatus Obscuribacterales bacterium]